MSYTVENLTSFLEQFAPLTTAESWDNVGLLLGDHLRPATSVMTCLTLTPDVAAEAIEKNVDLIVTHHPVLFRPVQKVTTETPEGKMLWELATHQIAVYSPHTAFDSAAQGINQQWGEELSLANLQPLRLFDSGQSIEDASSTAQGSGRYGTLLEPISLSELVVSVKKICKAEKVQLVGNVDSTVGTVGIACGAAAEYMKDARSSGCEVLITGEARFHACLEARILGIALILVGHYPSERFACEALADKIQKQFPSLVSFPSAIESDPISFL